MATKKTPAKAQKPSEVDFTDDLGAGFENVDQGDLGIPFLSILQKLSPECDEDNAKYVEGAKPGDIILSTNKKVYGDKSDSLIFVPCGYQKAYVEWTPRESGGGYVTAHAGAILNQTSKNDRNQDVLDNGNLIVTTSYVMGFVYDEDEDEWLNAVISMTSTQLKKARQWLNMMSAHKMEKDGKKLSLPMYSHKYNLHTVLETKAENNWYGWSIETNSMVDTLELVTAAREAHKEIAGGSMRMLAPPSTDTNGEAIPF